jgi:hypothetical protein
MAAVYNVCRNIEAYPLAAAQDSEFEPIGNIPAIRISGGRLCGKNRLQAGYDILFEQDEKCLSASRQKINFFHSSGNIF